MKFRNVVTVFLAALLIFGLLPVESQAANIQDLIKKYNPDAAIATSPNSGIFGGTLKADPCYKEGGYVFGSSIARDKIESVTFLDSLTSAPSSSWDVSQERNNSVRAWTKSNGSRYDLYIAANGNVKAPEDCSGMFYGYTNMEKIRFDGNFDTEDATNMNLMFTSCSDLDRIDCDGFDTSNVTTMSCMFMYCEDLVDVDVSDFDTSKVWDMGSMFWGCKSLCYIDISNFNYDRVSNGVYMFEQCAPNIKVIW